jgi:hypothetical protein
LNLGLKKNPNMTCTMYILYDILKWGQKGLRWTNTYIGTCTLFERGLLVNIISLGYVKFGFRNIFTTFKNDLKNQDDSNWNSIHDTLMWRYGLWSQTLEVQVQIGGGVLLMANAMCYHISVYNYCCPHTHKSNYIKYLKNIYSSTNNRNPSPKHINKIHTTIAKTCIKTQKTYTNKFVWYKISNHKKWFKNTQLGIMSKHEIFQTQFKLELVLS